MSPFSSSYGLEMIHKRISTDNPSRNNWIISQGWELKYYYMCTQVSWGWKISPVHKSHQLPWIYTHVLFLSTPTSPSAVFILESMPPFTQSHSPAKSLTPSTQVWSLTKLCWFYLLKYLITPTLSSSSGYHSLKLIFLPLQGSQANSNPSFTLPSEWWYKKWKSNAVTFPLPFSLLPEPSG